MNHVREILIAELGIGRDEATQLMNSYWVGIDDLNETDEILLSEEPFYYAFCIIHHPTLRDNQPEWYTDHGAYREMSIPRFGSHRTGLWFSY